MTFLKFKKQLIFVIGSGRSGTHLLGRTFGNCEEIDAFIEADQFFLPITELAVGLNKNNADFDALLASYKKVFRRSKKQYILEKTHPNIWFVEQIRDYFPTAKFIGIRRDVYATVNSMLNHEGVLSWYNKLPLDTPNKFLGITDENKLDFKSLPLESKCTLRWKAHIDRLDYLAANFPDEVLVVDYEQFYDDYSNLMLILKEFLGVTFSIEAEPLNIEGKDKWKKSLTIEQIDNIKKVL